MEEMTNLLHRNLVPPSMCETLMVRGTVKEIRNRTGIDTKAQESQHETSNHKEEEGNLGNMKLVEILTLREDI